MVSKVVNFLFQIVFCVSFFEYAALFFWYGFTVFSKFWDPVPPETSLGVALA